MLFFESLRCLESVRQQEGRIAKYSYPACELYYFLFEPEWLSRDYVYMNITGHSLYIRIYYVHGVFNNITHDQQTKVHTYLISILNLYIQVSYPHNRSRIRSSCSSYVNTPQVKTQRASVSQNEKQAQKFLVILILKTRHTSMYKHSVTHAEISRKSNDYIYSRLCYPMYEQNSFWAVILFMHRVTQPTTPRFSNISLNENISFKSHFWLILNLFWSVKL